MGIINSIKNFNSNPPKKNDLTGIEDNKEIKNTKIINDKNNKKNDNLKNTQTENTNSDMRLTTNSNNKTEVNSSKKNPILFIPLTPLFTLNDIIPDEDLDEMNFRDALIYDQRTFFKYYWGRLQYCQLLIFTFYTKNDDNLRFLKIAWFFNSLCLFLTMNSLFFNDSSMTHIYKEKGKFDVVYEIPKILFSTIITAVINFLMKFLCLTHDDMKKIKEIKEPKKREKKAYEIYKSLKIKFVIFYFLLFVLNIFYIYYTSIFCSVYQNTQFHLFKDTISSFATSMIYPFFLALIPTTLRFMALRKKNSCLYSISKIAQLIA